MVSKAEPRDAGHRRVISYDDAVRAGRRVFLRDSELDMAALADELAVSRATLYRVAESRDRLLGDVLWTFGAHFFQQATEATEAGGARGVDRLLEVMRRFGEQLTGAEPFRRFLAQDWETAVMVLFTPAGRVHERFVAVNRELIQATVDAGEVSLPFDVDSFAYVFVRIYESMWYADLLSGREPDQALAERVARASFAAS